MLISNNFSSLNSNKALNYKKNVNSKNNSDNISQKKSMNNPSFGSAAEFVSQHSAWFIAAGILAIGTILTLAQKYGKSLDEIQHREIGDKRRKANFSRPERVELKRRAKNIKRLHDEGAVVSKAVKRAAKLATA